jgi:cell division protein FtsL
MTHSSPLRTIDDSYRKQQQEKKKAIHEYKREFSPTNKAMYGHVIVVAASSSSRHTHKQTNKTADAHAVDFKWRLHREEKHNREPY